MLLVTGKERFIKQHWQSHGKKALQPIFNHLWDTDISFRSKQKELRQRAKVCIVKQS
jgi:hypothetical protein